MLISQPWSLNCVPLYRLAWHGLLRAEKLTVFSQKVPASTHVFTKNILYWGIYITPYFSFPFFFFLDRYAFFSSHHTNPTIPKSTPSKKKFLGLLFFLLFFSPEELISFTYSKRSLYIVRAFFIGTTMAFLHLRSFILQPWVK